MNLASAFKERAMFRVMSEKKSQKWECPSERLITSNEMDSLKKPKSKARWLHWWIVSNIQKTINNKSSKTLSKNYKRQDEFGRIPMRPTFPWDQKQINRPHDERHRYP